jgi:hypothetical protein
MLLTSLPDSSVLSLSIKMTATLVWHSANIAVLLITWKSPLNPTSDPLCLWKSRSHCQASDPSIRLKPTTLVFQVLLNVLTQPPLLASLVKYSCCYAVSQHLILDPLVSPLCKCTNVSITYIMICAVWPQLTRISRGRELGQEGMCNRVHDRYEYKVAYTLAQATRSSWCGRQLCKQHERNNMWYKRELIKNTYSTTAYAGLTAMRDLPRFIVYHSDVMWPYYSGIKKSNSRCNCRFCHHTCSQAEWFFDVMSRLSDRET